MLSLYWLRFHRARWQLTLAAYVASLAALTKQTGAVVVGPVALWCLWEDWQTSGRRLGSWREWKLSSGYALPLFALIGIGTALLNGVIDDHFLLHIVNAQQSHGTRPEMIGWFFWRDLLRPLPIVCSCRQTDAWSWNRRCSAA